MHSQSKCAAMGGSNGGSRIGVRRFNIQVAHKKLV